MRMFVILKPGYPHEVVALIEERYGRLNTGLSFHFLVEFMDLRPIPGVITTAIERVTGEESIFAGFRSNGLYRAGGATRSVTTCVMEIEGTYQHISVSGPTIESVREIYSLVRQGKLAPAEDYEAPESWRAPAPSELEELRGRVEILEGAMERVTSVIALNIPHITMFDSPATGESAAHDGQPA